jgi:putative membrane protein
MPSTSSPVDIREHLAAERTLLAYVRTGLALMGFGFVVARFGLFLREIRFVQSGSELPPTGSSVLFGTILVLLGVVVSIVSAHQYSRQVRRLNQIAPPGNPMSWVAVGLSLSLAAIGVAIAIYLLALNG